MKQLLLSSLAFFTFYQGQAQELDWAAQLGGTDNENGYGITTDGDGNVYTTGMFASTADFDPGAGTEELTSTAFFDGFVTKLDASGNLVWAKQISGASTIDPQSIAVDGAGNIFVFGSFEGTADFDPGAGVASITTAGNRDMFLLKLNDLGEYEWVKKYGAANWDYGYSVTVDADDNVIFTGAFREAVVFDPGWGSYNLTPAGQHDAVVCKVNGSNGNTLWAVGVGGVGNDYGWDVAVDASGNIYTAGYFEVTADLDPGSGVENHTSAGTADGFVLKLDSDGNYQWSNSIGSTGWDAGYGISVNSAGDVVWVGTFSGTVDMDSGPGLDELVSAGEADGFICSMDTDGVHQWAKSVGGTAWDLFNKVELDSEGNLIAAGQFQETIDLDPGSGSNMYTSAGFYDGVVLKLDENGDYVLGYGFGNSTQDQVQGVAIDQNDDFYIYGQFGGTINMDPFGGTTDLTPAGGQDLFIQKIDQNPGSGGANLKELGKNQLIVYPNPTTALLNSSLNYESATILDLSGRELRHFEKNQAIDASGLSNGMYLIMLDVQGEMVQSTFFKQ